MNKKRKLWKVVHGDATFRPESKAKVYEIYVPNARRRDRQPGWIPHLEVWVDERDGAGWCLYEQIDLREEPWASR